MQSGSVSNLTCLTVRSSMTMWKEHPGAYFQADRIKKWRKLLQLHVLLLLEVCNMQAFFGAFHLETKGFGPSPIFGRLT